MNLAKPIVEFLQGLAIQSPVLIVAIIGAIITLSRWKDAPGSGGWSLFGFALAAMLCVLIPAGQAGVRYWISEHPTDKMDVVQAFMILSVLWSLLRAASYIFLLVAIYAGRGRGAAGVEGFRG